MVYDHLGTLPHHLLVTLLSLPLASSPPSLLLLVRRLNRLTDEDLRGLVQRVLQASIPIPVVTIVTIVRPVAAILLLGLQLLDTGDAELDVIEEGDPFELDLFAEGRDELI